MKLSYLTVLALFATAGYALYAPSLFTVGIVAFLSLVRCAELLFEAKSNEETHKLLKDTVKYVEEIQRQFQFEVEKASSNFEDELSDRLDVFAKTANAQIDTFNSIIRNLNLHTSEIKPILREKLVRGTNKET